MLMVTHLLDINPFFSLLWMMSLLFCSFISHPIRVSSSPKLRACRAEICSSLVMAWIPPPSGSAFTSLLLMVKQLLLDQPSPDNSIWTKTKQLPEGMESDQKAGRSWRVAITWKGANTLGKSSGIFCFLHKGMLQYAQCWSWGRLT